MTATSLDKGKIKILLLEGVHSSGVEAFRRDGYSDIEQHPKALPREKLLESISDAYFVGIRSATQLTREVFDAAPRLIGVGCFCIGTNQVDLEAAQERGIPVFNAPFSNTRSVAELVLAEIDYAAARDSRAQRGGASRGVGQNRGRIAAKCAAKCWGSSATATSGRRWACWPNRSACR